VFYTGAGNDNSINNNKNLFLPGPTRPHFLTTRCYSMYRTRTITNATVRVRVRDYRGRPCDVTPPSSQPVVHAVCRTMDARETYSTRDGGGVEVAVVVADGRPTRAYSGRRLLLLRRGRPWRRWENVINSRPRYMHLLTGPRRSFYLWPGIGRSNIYASEIFLSVASFHCGDRSNYYYSFVQSGVLSSY